MVSKVCFTLSPGPAYDWKSDAEIMVFFLVGPGRGTPLGSAAAAVFAKMIRWRPYDKHFSEEQTDPPAPKPKRKRNSQKRTKEEADALDMEL